MRVCICLQQYGTWDRQKGLNVSETRKQAIEDAARALTNSTLKVAVVEVSIHTGEMRQWVFLRVGKTERVRERERGRGGDRERERERERERGTDRHSNTQTGTVGGRELERWGSRGREIDRQTDRQR